ncbi:MAG: ABC transporter ATP-binding protein [Bifidobacteriaceae bacterium]|jgi:ABC-2 type transport system ATP-binding protein|nr:ABC transporter ATP-binding protein [Bifidobacteriaceae bacterium]
MPQGAPPPDQSAEAASCQGAPPAKPAPPAQGAPPAIVLKELTKAFGGVRAVDRIDLAIPAGSLYGFVGPNGAGKTTTLSMATGLLRPDAGEVRVAGLDLWADPPAAKARLGVLPDALRLFDRLTGAELLTYTGRLRGMDRATIADRAGQILASLDLGADAAKPVADYSAGMTKKIGLGCAIIHAPDILVLDEPFEAIDPLSAAAIRAILQGFVRSGGTVVLSSHVMAAVEAMCDHVAVIAQGRIIAAGPVAEVAAGESLERRFLDLLGGGQQTAELTWLRPS